MPLNFLAPSASHKSNSQKWQKEIQKHVWFQQNNFLSENLYTQKLREGDILKVNVT